MPQKWRIYQSPSYKTTSSSYDNALVILNLDGVIEKYAQKVSIRADFLGTM